MPAPPEGWNVLGRFVRDAAGVETPISTFEAYPRAGGEVGLRVRLAECGEWREILSGDEIVTLIEVQEGA
jgi:hypothetical protein